jgi:hypothetical protein
MGTGNGGFIEMSEAEARKKLFSASRTGNLKLMKKVFE